MTSTVQISPELRQTVLAEKINHACSDASELIKAQLYDQALKKCHQIFDNFALLSNPEQSGYWVFPVLHDVHFFFQPLTQLSSQEQDKWIEWLKKVQQYVLNLKENPVKRVDNLTKLAQVYQVLGRTDLVAIALQQATEATLQIPEIANRVYQFIDMATTWVQYQQTAQAQQLITQALAAVKQIPIEEQQNHLLSIAKLYVQMGEGQRALALVETIAGDYAFNSYWQELLGAAIKRGDLHLAQAIAPKIQGAEYQARALVEIAVYWATHHQPRVGNRLFAQALKRVAKEENAEGLQAQLIEIYSKSGQLNIALNAAQRLTQVSIKSYALGIILVGYAKAKQFQQMHQIFNQLMDLMHSQPVMDVVGSLLFTAQSALDAEQYNLLMMILNAVPNNLDLTNHPHLASKPEMYRGLVQVVLQSQHLDTALQLAQQIPHDIYPEEHNSSLQATALAYANAQKWSQAIDVLAQIKNTPLTPYQVLTTAELAAIAPTTAEFTNLIQPAIAQAQDLAPIEPKALALAAIAHAYLRAKDTEQAQSFLQQTIQTAQQVEDQESRGRLLTKITDYLLQQRQAKAALTIAQANPVSQPQSSYNSIFYVALSSSAFDVALQVADLESLPETQSRKLLTIAKTYAQLERNKDAIVLLDRAFEVAQKIADPETRITEDTGFPDDNNDRRSQYTRLVKQYVALQRPDKAQQVVEKAQDTSLRDYLQAWIDC